MRLAAVGCGSNSSKLNGGGVVETVTFLKLLCTGMRALTADLLLTIIGRLEADVVVVA